LFMSASARGSHHATIGLLETDERADYALSSGSPPVVEVRDAALRPSYGLRVRTSEEAARRGRVAGVMLLHASGAVIKVDPVLIWAASQRWHASPLSSATSRLFGARVESLTDDPNLRLVARATRAEQFSLWAMRLWWHVSPELQFGWSELLHGFGGCGVSSAVEPCHRFCSLILGAGGCGPRIACIHFPRILPIEEQLLGALAVGTTGEPWVVEASLRTFLPAAVARSAAPLAVDYARILSNAGLDWPGAPTSHVALRAYEDVCIVSGRLH
jgi:hypothetical protein